jgi:hypothetical protein
MKKIYMVLTFSISLVLIAASGGVGEEQNKDRSGSPDGDNVCSQCHSSGSFSPEINLSITNEEGTAVTSYIPGETYLLEYAVAGTSGNPLAFGFQSTALSDENANSGTFANPGTQAQLETVSNTSVTARSIVEHSSPSSSGTWLVEWIAPSAFNGNVTFYYSGVAANGNGVASGDGYIGGSTVITPDFDSSISDQSIISDLELRGSDSGVVIYGSDNALMERVEVYSVSGRLISKDVNAKLPLLLDNSNLVSGINIIVCTSGEITRTFKMFN